MRKDSQKNSVGQPVFKQIILNTKKINLLQALTKKVKKRLSLQ